MPAAQQPGRVPDDQVPWLALPEPSGRIRTLALPTNRNVATIGRLEDNLVAVPWDPNVSRVHAQLQRLGPEWTIADDGLSRNGTILNGRPLAGRRRLRDGDVIQVGLTRLTFRDLRDRAGTTVAPGDRRPPPALTEAQRQVLAALSRPCLDPRTLVPPASNRQIAAELCLSVAAVKTHLRSLFTKFEIDDLPHHAKRVRLVAEALERRAITP